MFSKRNDKSGHIKESEKNQSEGEGMLRNKTRDCKREISDRKTGACRKCDWERISRKKKRIKGRKG